jgi:hypothetical protein
MIFTVLFKIRRFFIQPTELYTGVSSATGFHISQHVAAVCNRNLGGICRTRAFYRDPDRKKDRSAQEQKRKTQSLLHPYPYLLRDFRADCAIGLPRNSNMY